MVDILGKITEKISEKIGQQRPEKKEISAPKLDAPKQVVQTLNQNEKLSLDAMRELDGKQVGHFYEV